MKKILQMLQGSFVNKGLGFEKYLIAFCMLIGVQQQTIAQVEAGQDIIGDHCDGNNVTSLRVDGKPGTKVEKLSMQDYVYHVPYGGTVNLSVSVFGNVEVTWEKKTSKDGVWELVAKKQSNQPLEITNVQKDVLYRATFSNGFSTTEQRALLVTGGVASDINIACPNEAVQLDLYGGEFAYRSQWYIGYGAETPSAVNEYVDGTRTYAVNAGTTPLNSYVILKYDEYYCSGKLNIGSGSSKSPRFTSESVKVNVSDDCKKECQTTSTGEYYVGTGFDPASGTCNPGGKIPDDVYEFFEDYHIIFEENEQFTQKTDNWDVHDGRKYWLGCDAEKFFGQVPDMDAKTGANGVNNYMFAQGNINANLVTLKFQVWDYKPNPNWEGVRGKTYQYKMRAYVQLDEGCTGEKWSNAQFLARTGHGNQTWDITEVSAYDNATSRLLGTKTVYGPNDAVLLKDVIGQDYLYNMSGYDLVRFEVVFYGSFPMTENGIQYFSFEPRFQQFECAKLAIDYISAEIENVCLSPNVVCIGDSTTANAAGFPKDSKFTWYRDDGGVWVKYAEGDASTAATIKIPVTKLGKEKHMLVVSGKKYNPDGSQTDFENKKYFSVGGKNCKVPTPTAIEGSRVYCLPNADGMQYSPNIPSKLANYQWILTSPDGDKYDSKKGDSHFEKVTSNLDTINVKFNDADPEGEWKLELHTFGESSEQGNPIEIKISVYKTPQVSLKLVGDKYVGIVNEVNKELCPSDIRKDVIAVAQNGFESIATSLYNYKWTSSALKSGVWESNTNDSEILVPRLNNDSADVHIEKVSGICQGLVDSVAISVKVDILGCADSDTNKYGVTKPSPLTIDCDGLKDKIEKDPYIVPVGKEDTTIRVPIPDFDSGCDSDPNLNIEIKPLRTAVLDTLGVININLYKSEIATSKALTVRLPWGQYNFTYTVTDGCGQIANCTTPIEIKKLDGPIIPCDSIRDIVVKYTDFNQNASNKCLAKIDVDSLPYPEFQDQNDEKKTKLKGIYAGRRHFDYNSRPSKGERDNWKTDEKEQAKFDMSVDLYDEYEIDYTYILWKFTNAAGNSSYCVQEVWVRDTVKPYFDCSTIDPFEFRPITDKNKCEIKFEEFWPQLKAKNYIAYDSCPEPITPIYGVLHTDSINNTPVPDDMEFHVGDSVLVYWQFRDRHENVKYCPQIINATSSDSVKIDCDLIDYFEATADSGTCFVDAAKLNIPNPPYGEEPCLDKNGNVVKVAGVGTRRDGKALDEPYPTGYTYIDWVFTGRNSTPSNCLSTVFVHGNKHFNIDCNLLFPDVNIEVPECDSTKVKLEPKSVPDPCVAGYMSESLPYLTTYVKDANKNVIDTTYTLITTNPYDFGRIGEHFVSWIFWDYTKSVSDTCVQSIHLRDNKTPIFDCDNIKDQNGNKDTIFVDLKGSCTISPEDLRDSLGVYYATEACTGDPIASVVYELDTITGQRHDFPASVNVGLYRIIYVFANDSLTTKEKECEKTLLIRSNFAPPFDCSTLKEVTLIDTVGLCVVPVDSTLLPIPETHDYCKVDYPVYAEGYIQIKGTGDYKKLAYYDRNKKQSVYLMSIPFGEHKVKWVFKSMYSTDSTTCYQNVVSMSDALSKINCEDLASVVRIEFKGPEEGPTYAEVVAAGLIHPLVIDPCHVLDTLFTRNDGRDIYTERYPVNNTTLITWYFKDITLTKNNEKTCYTQVIVENGETCPPPCPTIPGTFLCEADVNVPYATFTEFMTVLKSQGQVYECRGVDMTNAIDPSKFYVTETRDGDGKCDYNLIRTYHFGDYRNQTTSCDQIIKIKDDKGPIWNIGASTTNSFECEAVDFFPTNLNATDQCKNTTYSVYNKVNQLTNIVDGLFYTIETNRSDDPSQCAYYRYYEKRTYVAVDECHNQSTPLVYLSNVGHTNPPILNIPQDWRDSMFVADYGVPCIFTVPDLRNSLPDGSFSDYCGRNELLKYYNISQIPAPGTQYDPDKGSQYVTLYIADPCGNYDTVQHLVYVPTRKEVISETMYSKTICAEKALPLKSKVLSEFKGKVWTYNIYTDQWGWDSTSKVVFDYYRGVVAEENLIFSNNPKTYGDRFDRRSEIDLITLNDTSQTGLYSIVVMDTIRFCTDTADAYITVHHRPYISMDAGSLLVCERDSIHLISDNEILYDKYKVEVDSVGEVITEQGWSLDSVKYEPMSVFPYDTDVRKLQYYATNVCGTGYSSDYVAVGIKKRMSPEDLMLVTDPQDKPRVLLGENASLQLITKYKPRAYRWMRVRGVVDGIEDEVFDKEGNVREEYKNYFDDDDEELGSTLEDEPGNKKITLYALGDTASYYVLLIDSVCPAVPSNVVAIDVVKQLPTAFTPHNSIGMNDIFMEGHHVIIFNRYGLKMTESDNGWDGTCRGQLVDPGVYYYEVIINEGERHKGSIEVVYFK